MEKRDGCLTIDCKSKEYKKELQVAQQMMDKIIKVIKHYEKGIDNLKSLNQGILNRIQTLPNDTLEETQQKMKNGDEIKKNEENIDLTRMIIDDIIEAITEVEVEKNE